MAGKLCTAASLFQLFEIEAFQATWAAPPLPHRIEQHLKELPI
jgi:hypothetical protein